jgi:DNA-binding transcriptional MerR regulator
MLQLNLWISELAEMTGVSTRTIRYYIEEGLLPQPEVQGKYAVFNEDYLTRLKLIKYLKDAYLPLKEIKRQLDSLMIPEMHDLVRKFETDPSRALAGLGIYPAEKNKVLEIDFSKSAPATDSAQEYIKRTLNRQPAAIREPAMKFNAQAPAPGHNPAASSENWQRVELAPGVELNIRQPQSSTRRSQVEELIAFARKLFKREEYK